MLFRCGDGALAGLLSHVGGVKERGPTAGRVLESIFDNPPTQPQPDTGFRPSPACGSIGRHGKQVIFDTGEAFGELLFIAVPPLDPMSAILAIPHAPPTGRSSREGA
jgi:hypothetical protein